MDQISIDDFKKLDIRMGKIIEATEVEGSDKLIRCLVNFGELGTRVIFSGVKKWYKADDLVGKILPYIVNLIPRKMFGEESQGMLMAIDATDKNGDVEAILLNPEKEIEPGTKII